MATYHCYLEARDTLYTFGFEWSQEKDCFHNIETGEEADVDFNYYTNIYSISKTKGRLT